MGDPTSTDASAGAVVTTLAKYAGQYASGYNRLPTIDVPIIWPPNTCARCGKPIHLVSEGAHGRGWAHVEDPTPGDAGSGHIVRANSRCRYCGSNDPKEVTFRQHPWHDAVECDRCGGVTGRAIGD